MSCANAGSQDLIAEQITSEIYPLQVRRRRRLQELDDALTAHGAFEFQLLHVLEQPTVHQCPDAFIVCCVVTHSERLQSPERLEARCVGDAYVFGVVRFVVVEDLEDVANLE